jgi:hypothetical protein
MHDALHGGETRSRPGQRERDCSRLARRRLVIDGLGRHVAHQADLERRRRNGHTFDMAFDQVAFRQIGRKLRQRQMRPNAIHYQLLDFGCRHPWDAVGLFPLVLQERVGT